MSYVVKALGRDERIISLVVEADSAIRAEQHAQAQGYAVLGVRRNFRLLESRTTRAPGFSALLFSQELLALLSAGLTLVEALQALKRTRRYALDGIAPAIAHALTEGVPFSAAIARHPQQFSPLYIATIQASERTGDLEEALRRYVGYQEQMDRLRNKVVSACLYPAFLLLSAALVMLFLLFYVIPRFGKVYESIAGDLPFFSKMLISAGQFMSAHGWLLGAAALASVAAAALLTKAPVVRRRLQGLVQRIPALAEQVQLYELTRLYRTSGMLLKAGVPITQALGMLDPLVSAGSRNKLAHARRLIAEGRSISTAMTHAALATPIAERMLLVGERAGSMGLMMERAALFHEDELARRIEEFSKLFEPVLMLVLGVIVGGLVVLMYMPVFELAAAVQA